MLVYRLTDGSLPDRVVITSADLGPSVAYTLVMTRPAVIEAWHSTLTFELRSRETFTTKAAARARVPAWIDDYNRHRRHSACGMLSPVDYELAHARQQAA